MIHPIETTPALLTVRRRGNGPNGLVFNEIQHYIRIHVVYIKTQFKVMRIHIVVSLKFYDKVMKV